MDVLVSFDVGAKVTGLECMEWAVAGRRIDELHAVAWRSRRPFVVHDVRTEKTTDYHLFSPGSLYICEILRNILNLQRRHAARIIQNSGCDGYDSIPGSVPFGQTKGIFTAILTNRFIN
jgi:hypothetical protein